VGPILPALDPSAIVNMFITFRPHHRHHLDRRDLRSPDTAPVFSSRFTKVSQRSYRLYDPGGKSARASALNRSEEELKPLRRSVPKSRRRIGGPWARSRALQKMFPGRKRRPPRFSLGAARLYVRDEPEANVVPRQIPSAFRQRAGVRTARRAPPQGTGVTIEQRARKSRSLGLRLPRKTEDI